LDNIPGDKLDEEFADAYVEELVERISLMMMTMIMIMRRRSSCLPVRRMEFRSD